MAAAALRLAVLLMTVLASNAARLFCYRQLQSGGLCLQPRVAYSPGHSGRESPDILPKTGVEAYTRSRMLRQGTSSDCNNLVDACGHGWINERCRRRLVTATYDAETR